MHEIRAVGGGKADPQGVACGRAEPGCDASLKASEVGIAISRVARSIGAEWVDPKSGDHCLRIRTTTTRMIWQKTSATKSTATAPKKAATPVARKAKGPIVKKAAATKTVAPTPLKPIKDSFTKASLTVHLAERAGVEPKAAKALMAALEETVLASVHKKGAKEFTLPGLLKVVAQDVPAKKKRFGKDPFTGEDKWFAAKPATVRLKVRPLKKLKDAAL